MKLQGRNLSVSMRPAHGDDVALLHRELGQLIEAGKLDAQIEPREISRKLFGPTTEQTVVKFQRQQGLGATAEVDERIARAINKEVDALKPKSFHVQGKVAKPDGSGIPDLIIRAFDRCLGKEKQLGETKTDADGNYLLTYRAENLINPDRNHADLLVRVYSRREVLESTSPLIINALPKEVVNLALGEEAYRGPDLYSKIDQALADYLEGIALDEIEPRDLYCLANNTNMNIEWVHHYVLARQWDKQWGELSPEVFFAWFREGMPGEWGILLGRDLSELQSSIESAVEKNLVSRSTLRYLDKLEASLIEWRSNYVITSNARPLAQASLGQLLKASALSEDQSRQLMRQWQTFEGKADDFWAAQQEQLGEAVSQDLDLTLQLGALTRNHLPLIKLLKEQANIRQFADTARFGKEDWLKLFEESELEMLPDIQGEDLVSQKQAYAEALSRFTEQMLPTRVLAEALARDTEIDSRQMDRFFTQNPDFEFRNQSIRNYLEDKPEALVDFPDPKATQLELEAMQRVFHLSPANNRYAVAKVLWQNHLHSAWAVTLRGEQELLEMFKGEPISAKQVFYQAQSAQQVSQAAMLLCMDKKYSPGYVFPPSKSQSDSQIEGIPDIESLFGGQGYCECKHCLSFFSPSAYLVDLFLYLKKAKLSGGSASPPVDTVLEKLFERRPDLANLELDCENALTVLPYIDLVNEVLENAITPRGYTQKDIKIGGKTFTLPVVKPSEPVPQTEVDSDSLRAFPQHLNPAAYQILQTGDQEQGLFYPWNLPFNLWLSEVRSYLQHLNAPRWRLMESLLGQHVNEEDVATEYLGLIPSEKNILLDANPNNQTLGQYWGISGTLVELGKVETLLKHSGFSYEELRQLLALRYIQSTDPNQTLRIQFEPVSSCQIADARLENLNEGVLNRIHRLGRLQRKTGDTLMVLDQTLTALGTNINEGFLLDYAYLKRVEQTLPRRMKRSDILSWWNLLDTYDYPGQDSLYRSLFLNPSLNNPVEAEFELNDAKNELKKASENQATIVDLSNPDLDPDLQALILAPLRWNIIELKAVVNDKWDSSSFELNLSNLSYLYRVSGFCRALRIKAPEYLALKAVLGTSPLPGPDQVGVVRPKDTFAFIKQYRLIQEVGLDAETLDYLLRHQYRADASFALGVDETAQILFDLQVQLTKLLNEADPEGIPIRENLEIKLSRVLLAENVITALQLIENDPELNLSEQEKKEFFDEKLHFSPDLVKAKSQLIDGGLSDLKERYQFVLEALEIYLVENSVVQQLSEALAMSTELTESLLRVHLSHPSDPGLPVIRVFFAPDFVNAAEGSEFTEVYFPEQVSTVLRLQKIGLICSSLELDTNTVNFTLKHGVEAGLPDLSKIPVTPIANALSSEAFKAWELLMESVRINRRKFHGNATVFDVLRYPLDSEHSQPELVELLSAATGWDINDLIYLSGPSGLNLSYPLDYQSGAWLVKMAKTLSLVKPVGISAQQMAEWAGLEVTQAQAISVRHAVKAKYGHEQWLEITAALRNQIREQQRDALLSFVMHHRRKHDQVPFEDVDDIYAYYLIDPQMSACANTSRTVLACSSVQLFMQRIQLNLEPGITMSRKHAEEWKWRKYYRVWEANRKVFLWPENWIEPELRDDKSPFFQELENELLQDELKEETVERAYINYLYKLDEVAHLEICAVHYEAEVGTLHVFGRTAGTPPVYYYRRWEKRREWTPWEKLELDISNAEGVETPQTGVLLLPVVHNRRLFLFWPIFTLKRDELSYKDQKRIKGLEELLEDKEEDLSKLRQEELQDVGIQNEIIKDIGDIRDEIKFIKLGYSSYMFKMAWSQYRQGHWTAKKLTNKALVSPKFKDNFKKVGNIRNHFFVPIKTVPEGELKIDWYYSNYTTYYKLNGYFEFDSCRNELTCVKKSPSKMNRELPDWMCYMKARDDGSSPFPLSITNAANEVDVLLNKAEEHHYLSSSLDRGVFKHATPFFYEDKQRTFFVIPPPPTFQLGAVNSFNVQFQVMSGKANSLNEFAYKNSLIPTPEPQGLPSKVQVLGTKRFSSEFFHTSQSDQVLIRQEVAVEQKRSAVDTGQPNMLLMSAGMQEKATPGFSPSGVQLLKSGEYVFRTFYHSYTCLFLKQLNRYGIKGLLNPNPNTVDGKALNRQATPDHNQLFNFANAYKPNWSEVNISKAPREIITFDYDDAYANYNWELFFHIPLLIATRLHQDQRFETAQKWFHYIFDPTETQGDAPYRFWKIKPFHNYTQGQMLSDMKLLLQGKFKNQIQAWQEDPFNPHLLARFRRLAYMKTTVMKYLDNLIAWGDQLFRRDSIESINEATQLYVLAGQILGKLPVATESKNLEVKTFSQLAENIDALGNAWVEIQLSQQELNNDNVDNNSSNGNPDLIPYFCFPPNEKLLAYWDTIADRLYKIRNCMNIEGVVRQLPLFQPPIDPALLVRAAASGMDLSSALNDLYAPMPKYRFTVMIQKAQEICQELKSLGGSLLSALEKKDAEALSLMRVQQESALLKASLDIRANQLEEATYNLEALNEQKELSNIKFENYRDRAFINPAEVIAFVLSRVAAVSRAISAGVAGGGGVAHQTPDIYAGAIAGPMGGAITYTRVSGGDKAGKGITSISKWFDLAAIILKDVADANATIGSYQRRQEDWDLQRDLADQEIKQIEKQILASEIRIAIAEKEKENLELQISQSKTVAEFMKNKFTKQQLYGWMVGQLSFVYFQTYQLAYDIAKQAEKTFRHELGIQNSNYIQFGYWDNLRKGLLAGEKLSLDLKRLEMVYLEKNRREFELSKHISLALLDPLALVELRETGRCFLSLPEEIFDLDFPGHYFRRIKSVSLTLPCIIGPYTTVCCTLRLLKNSIRINTANGDNGYPRNTDNQGLPSSDDRFIENNIPVRAIATSTAQNDSGVFELSFRDERYLPFEGAGAISEWSLELFSDLPANNPDPGNPDFGKPLRQFDYNTISDAILHVKYTAREDAGMFKNGAVAHLRDYFSQDGATHSLRMFSLQHEFPTQWHRFLHPTDPADGNIFEFAMLPSLFPVLDQGKTLKINTIWLMARCTDPGSYDVVMRPPLPEPPPAGSDTMTLAPANQYGGLHFGQKDVAAMGIEVVPTAPPIKWRLKMTRPGGGNLQEDPVKKVMEVEDVLLVLGYEWE